jgi:hypothetical protein
MLFFVNLLNRTSDSLVSVKSQKHTLKAQVIPSPRSVPCHIEAMDKDVVAFPACDETSCSYFSDQVRCNLVKYNNPNAAVRP